MQACQPRYDLRALPHFGAALCAVVSQILRQEVMKGQLPLSVGGLRGQGVEQFGRSEAFVSSLAPRRLLGRNALR